jgi:hypothetical protein
MSCLSVWIFFLRATVLSYLHGNFQATAKLMACQYIFRKCAAIQVKHTYQVIHTALGHVSIILPLFILYLCDQTVCKGGSLS